MVGAVDEFQENSGLEGALVRDAREYDNGRVNIWLEREDGSGVKIRGYATRMLLEGGENWSDLKYSRVSAILKESRATVIELINTNTGAVYRLTVGR
jgi:hypothetical protein